LQVDPERKNLAETGIYVRAKDGDNWVSADIAHLDRESLKEWLHSRGDCNPWAENTIAHLLAHNPAIVCVVKNE
jgi:hypothetical protein